MNKHNVDQFDHSQRLWQLLFLETPPHAAVDTSVRLVGRT